MTTTCPIELRFVNNPDIVIPYATFERRFNKKYNLTSVNDKIKEYIGQYIRRTTSESVKLTITSNTYPNMIVIDLPGLNGFPSNCKFIITYSGYVLYEEINQGSCIRLYK
jgi:hypothetical protein